jgi:hypothetical protein
VAIATVRNVINSTWTRGPVGQLDGEEDEDGDEDTQSLGSH